ncbi:hypothetical protein F5883DRAFT_531450 [Diaporthe sp. PMI_573]|nr:hypothetical protein F5883DRAFT_531450 [Diaporthaceae sp. PMI_573]
MMANACLAAYIRGGNATEIFRCVNVDNQTVARDELCACYGCTETIIREWVTSSDVC